MKFFRGKDYARVKKIKASRAVFIDLDTQEIEITFINEEGEKLSLQMPSRLAPQLIRDLTSSYTAINPPLNVNSRAATWDGMTE